MTIFKNLLRFTFVPLIIYALALPAVGQTVSNGKATTAAPVYTNNTARPLSLDLLGNLRVSATPSGSGVTAQEVQGNAASGATDVGNPVKIGGVFNTTLPTVTDGQRVNQQMDTRGAAFVVLKNSGSASGSTAVLAVNNTATGGDAAAANLGAAYVSAFGEKWNGATWDRDFTCPNSAVINVTAAATTQLVALSGSTVIRVCSFVVTASATGTATFVYGTGANCGTGTTALTGAMAIVANGNITVSPGAGSVFRGAAANALCLTAVTGNMTGVVSYAQY